MFTPRTTSFKSQKQYKQLQQRRQILNKQMTISNQTQATFTITSDSSLHLPTISASKLKPRADRLASQRNRYQIHLKSILTDIKDKIDMSKSLGMQLVKERKSISNKKRLKRKLPQGMSKDFSVKPINLEPKVEPSRNHLDPDRYSPQKLAEIRRRKRYEKFDFQPWNTIEQLQMQALSILD